MAIPLRCRCGKLQGEVETDRSYAVATCYCKHCQAYARWLGQPGITDAQGGTGIVALAPSAVRFTSGLEHLACMSLSERGLLRWYAACCRTPLGNTPRDPRVHYAGMVDVCMETAPGAVDAAFGSRDRVVLNTGSATGPVKATPIAFLIGGLRIFANILAARLRGRRDSPFFDAATGEPVRLPMVVDVRRQDA